MVNILLKCENRKPREKEKKFARIRKLNGSYDEAWIRDGKEKKKRKVGW
jgi:hypothetical protein